MPVERGAVTSGPQQPTTLWALKPWWCQPWSILLTGVAVVAGSCWGVGRWWISLPLALGVLAWWALFLVVVPAAWQREQQLAGRPGAAVGGILDTADSSAPSPAPD